MRNTKLLFLILSIFCFEVLFLVGCSSVFCPRGWLYIPTPAFYVEAKPEWAAFVQMADSALADRTRGGENWSLDYFDRLFIEEVNMLIVNYQIKKGYSGQCWQVLVQIEPPKVKGVYETYYLW